MSVPFGKNIKLYIEGNAHDEKITMRLSGIPSGIAIQQEELAAFLSRRSPSNSWETQRKEKDIPFFENGITNEKTDGGIIKAVIKNENTDSSVYSDVNRFPRPSHADYPAIVKYGKDTDLRGGGHFSGRLTALTCVAGFIALKYLEQTGINIFAHIYSVNDIYDAPFEPTAPIFEKPEAGKLPVSDKNAQKLMRSKMEKARSEGDSLGGIIECAITGLKAGIGEHMFASVEAVISDALFSVPAVKGIEFGAGFEGAKLRGSEYNDQYFFDGDSVKTKTNNCGGILGGMTNGMPVIFRVALKPTPSIGLEQNTVDLLKKENTVIRINGRHDACIVPRAVPVIEAATALAVMDLILSEHSADETLSDLRRQIDSTDEAVITLLKHRNELSKAVAVNKKKSGKAVYDANREKELLDRIKMLAGEENSTFAEEIYRSILKNSKEIQKRITEDE